MSVERLAAAAVLGTERGVTAADTPALLPDLVTKATSDALPRALLRQAALETVAERAGRQLVAPVFPDVPACPPDSDPVVGERLHMLLVSLIDTEERAILAEALARIAQQGRRVPPRLIPQLVEAVWLQDRHRVVAAGGAVARWLVPQNPQWRTDGGVARSEDAWEEGDAQAQLDALRAWRDRDPAAARDALAQRFPELAPVQRAAAIETLDAGLSMADEPFLEGALDDRRKEVRVAAQTLLMQLPASRLAARAVDALRGRLRVDKGLLRSSLDVDLVEKATPAMRRDGLAEKPPAGYGGGEKAYWLEELVARTPPAALAELAGVDAERLITLAKKHEFDRALVRGVLRAAIGYADRATIDACFAAGLDLALLGFDSPLIARLARLPDSEALLLAQVRRRLESAHHAWLAKLPTPWSAALSGEVARRVRADWNSTKDRPNASGWLSILAYGLDPRVPEALDGWAEPQDYYQGTLTTYLRRVALRRDVYLSI